MATKKLTTGELNLMKEMGVDSAKAFDTALTETRHNRFSGVSVQMNETVAKLHDKFFAMMKMYENGQVVNVGKIDRVKYLILKLNGNAYMELID